MKEVFYFLKWVWDRWDKHDVAFFSSLFLIVMSWVPLYFFNSRAVSGLMILMAGLIFIAIIIKIIVIDPIRRSFKEYKKEKTNTIDRLKKDY